MSYIGRLWIGFAFVLSVLLTAMAFLSVTALRLDRAEAVAKQQAEIDEHVRLALWRMDSALAPLLAQENAHPQYRANVSSRNAAVRWRERSSSGAMRLMSPASDDDYVLLRFQYGVDASDVQPPASDVAGEPSLAEESAGSNSLPKTSKSRNAVDHLAKRIPRQHLLNKLPNAPSGSVPSLSFELAENSRKAFGTTQSKTATSRSTVEFQQRNQSLMSNNAMVQQLSSHDVMGGEPPAVMMTPVWTSDEMFLARRVQRNGGEYVQGCLLDWRAMQGWLLEMVEDLLPNARLEPLETFDAAGEPGLLAALPVRLLSGPLPEELQSRRSAVPQTLALAWFAVLLSSLVGAVLVVGVVRLSQRRGAFVAAVSHELRTPLTTFRMYSEMLAQGMVRDADAQREYLQALRDQSLRLSHLVENVLAYARLERGRGLSSPERTSLRQLIDPILPSLEQLAASEQMELVVERTASFEVPIWANPSAVEQILVNLIDNACKYAAGASDRRICLTAHREGRYIVLRIRDFGPGIPAKQRWFRPFDKSVQEAAHSAPGIGLGLALSRRLATQMGGRLDVDRTTTDGAALLLRFPTRKGA